MKAVVAAPGAVLRRTNEVSNLIFKQIKPQPIN